MKDKTTNYEEMEWEDAVGYPTGTKIKILRHHGEIKTFLLKLPKGAEMEAHCHTAPEQHFILEGEYQSDGKTFGKGIYRYIPAEVTHGPFVSKKRRNNISNMGSFCLNGNWNL
jgi:anti-sigma factor ChrR (cupin superfamily)